jgi:polar amino acid transport system substrate-binding protein
MAKPRADCPDCNGPLEPVRLLGGPGERLALRLRLHLLPAAAVALALAAAGCAAAPAAPLEPVVVASDLDNAPFAYVGDDGRPAGRDVEMMERLAAQAGLALSWRRLPFEELLPAAEADEVDVVCATLGRTPERAERVLFTRTYFATAIAVVVRRGPGEPASLAELDGLRVAGAAGTTSERAVRARLPRAAGVFENKGGLDAGARLAAREIDAAAMDAPAAEALAARSGGALRVLPEPLAGEDYALALPKGRAALRDRLDAALLALAAEWPRLDARHGLAPAAR